MLAVGIVAVAIAIAIAVYVVGTAVSGREAAAEVVVAPPAYPVPRSGIDPSQPLPALYKRFGALASRLTPASYGRNLQSRLDRAGNPRGWAPERVLALKGIGLVAGLVIGLVLGLPHGMGVLFFPVLGGAAGFFLPDIWIRNLGEHRQQDLVLGLPNAIDMMTVCVEAGLGFDAAVSRVALNLDGPIASEFARVMQEMQFGKSRTEALRAIAERTDVPEIRTFVSAMIQSSELGISVGNVLREQAREMRVKRRQRAEEKAQKLPVKILFPLLLCMLPAMFVVVVGPAGITIMKTLSGLHG